MKNNNRSSNSKMPEFRAKAQKVVSKVGLDYEVYDVCLCNKFLYYREGKDKL